MEISDMSEFSSVWNLSHEIMPNGRVFSIEAMRAIFAILSPYPLEIIKQAINSHMATAQFAPQPSDIVKIITMGTGGNRPSADEAWNDLPKNEEMPCVWTDEMAQAWGLVASNYYSGDKIGARMGFKACYERLCEEAKLFGKPVKWSFSHGTVKDSYKSVIERAMLQGRLSQQQGNSILQALPAPITNDGLLLIGSKKADKAIANAKMREKLAEMKMLLDDADKEEQERLNAEKLAAENERRTKEDAAIALLPPDQQLALRQANLERYGNEVLH